MTTLKNKIAKLESSLTKVELKDTSYRRSGGYFGTKKANTDGYIILKTITRTKNLNTYICTDVVNLLTVNEIADLKNKLQKKIKNKYAKDSIITATEYANYQIANGIVNTNYFKILIVGNKNIYFAHPYHQHQDYNKHQAMPNTARHRKVATGLNELMNAAKNI